MRTELEWIKIILAVKTCAAKGADAWFQFKQGSKALSDAQERVIQAELKLVETTGLAPATPCSQSRRSTLSYVP